ncbi:SLC13 family permease [Hwanghaeella sp.]|uniref:SLC13 family permease n=1 Tax=Hwanghaeella sp. TaxID=2605943 RepID=UPI003CCC3115
MSDRIPHPHRKHIEGQRLPARFGIMLGPAAFVLLRLLPSPGGMSEDAWAVAAVAGLMAVWWLTEAVPVAATALLPLALFPLLGQGSMKAVAAPYANPLIFLFMGGLMIALAVERWGLHRRIALAVLTRTGTRPRQLVAAFMAVAAGLSMWISNTASTIMMLPIALSVIAIVLRADRHDDSAADPAGNAAPPFAKALLIATAYGASMGGVATLVGTPPNALLAGFVTANLGITIGFAQWMALGLPTALVMLLLGWLILTRVVFRLGTEALPGAADAIRREAHALPEMSKAEKRTLAVFLATAALWIFRPVLQGVEVLAVPLAGLSDAGIAIAAGVALFCIPVDLKKREFLLNWEWARKLPWGVLILFGGGLSLAEQVSASGLAAWIGESLTVFQALPLFAIVLILTAVIVFLTELTSNTATTATFLPVIAALATAIDAPVMMLLVPAALAASMAFMMPVATPPNAIVFSGGQLTIPDMARAGFLVNVTAIAVIAGTVWLLAPLVFGT